MLYEVITQNSAFPGALKYLVKFGCVVNANIYWIKDHSLLSKEVYSSSSILSPFLTISTSSSDVSGTAKNRVEGEVPPINVLL